MRRFAPLVLIVAACHAAEPSPIVGATTAFACDLYGKVRQTSGNLLISPYSITEALAMTYVGAAGKTQEEMRAVLHLDGVDDPHAALGALRKQVSAARGCKLAIADNLWVERTAKFRESFLSQIQVSYGVTPILADFINAPDAQTTAINRWIADRTESRVPKLIPSGVITEDTRAVLANAIYFKGTWMTQFDPAETADEPFHFDAGDEKPVPLMHLPSQSLRCVRTEAYSAVDLPYSGEDLSMVVVVPSAIDGLGTIEKRLSSAMLETLLSSLHEDEAVVTLPKFTFRSPSDLGPMLCELGMPSAFDDDLADFSAMSGIRFKIGGVLHEAFIAVNEEGTEAAAATAVGMTMCACVGPEPVVIRADRPFLFLIRERSTGAILFLGRVTDPRG
jgi:serpin B